MRKREICLQTSQDDSSPLLQSKTKQLYVEGSNCNESHLTFNNYNHAEQKENTNNKYNSDNDNDYDYDNGNDSDNDNDRKKKEKKKKKKKRQRIFPRNFKKGELSIPLNSPRLQQRERS